MLGELTEIQIEEVLGAEKYGRIGCYDKGKVYIVPVTYIYDGKSIIAHSSAGMKIKMMRDNPEVCFEVEQVNDMQNWKTVILWGTYIELTGDEAGIAYDKLFSSIRNLKASKTLPDKDSGIESRTKSKRTEIIYKIIIREKTGRFEKAEIK